MQRFALLALTFALAATAGSKADDLLSQLKKGYEDCVSRSVRLRGMGSAAEAFELAFLACQSKEQPIIEHLGAVGMAPATTEKALKAFKLRLRKTAR
jgi:hypothetical protein